MTNIKKSIVCASLINTIFQEYEPGTLRASGELVRSRIGKYMRERATKNREEFIDAINTTHEAWEDAINHFAKDNVRIEAKSTIRAIYNYFSEEMSKYANIKDKHIENFMIGAVVDAEAEHNSDLVIDYIIEKLGLPKHISLFNLKG